MQKHDIKESISRTNLKSVDSLSSNQHAPVFASSQTFFINKLFHSFNRSTSILFPRLSLISEKHTHTLVATILSILI